MPVITLFRTEEEIDELQSVVDYINTEIEEAQRKQQQSQLTKFNNKEDWIRARLINIGSFGAGLHRRYVRESEVSIGDGAGGRRLYKDLTVEPVGETVEEVMKDNCKVVKVHLSGFAIGMLTKSAIMQNAFNKADKIDKRFNTVAAFISSSVNSAIDMTLPRIWSEKAKDESEEEEKKASKDGST